MRIKSKSKKPFVKLNLRKAWRLPAAAGLLVIAFGLGYISSPGWNFNSMVQAVKKVLIKSDQAVIEDIRQEVGLYTSNGLATIFLDIPFDSLISIEEKRTEALASGILISTDDDLVPASMHLNDGEPFEVKIRLKGDWTDHLVGDKWSFRIHVEDPQQAVLGMRRFSIQAPETRNYEKEWIYHQNLMDEGILTTRYYFVNVVQNGKYNGIYALEESFTEDLLESQGRREGPIIRFNEDLLWKNWENLGTVNPDTEKMVDEIGKFWITDADTSQITAFRQGHLTKDEILTSELYKAIELLHSFDKGLIPGDEVFDQELWGKYFALTDLWGSGHSTYWINLRFYYNPITGLLEPVVFDALPFEPSATKDKLAFPFADQGFIQEIFRLPGVEESYVRNLEEFTKESYLDQLQSRYALSLEHFHQVLTGYLEQGLFGDIPPLPWDELRRRASILASNLESPQPLQGTFRVLQVNGRDSLQVDLTNLMVLPVEIQALIVDGTSYAIDPRWCPAARCLDQLLFQDPPLILKEHANLSLIIPLNDLAEDLAEEPEITIKAVLFGGSTLTSNPITSNYNPQGIASGAVPIETLGHTLAVHPFLVADTRNSVRIKPGNWDVSGDLVLPQGVDLIIPAGVTLNFEPGTVLLVNGALRIEGQSDAPVILNSSSTSWGGIVVLGDGNTQSVWTSTLVKNAAGISRGGWVLTGGITFYQSNLSLSDVSIEDSQAEDALNLIHSDFTIRNSIFRDTASDALDGDFTQGTIEDSIMQNVNGDGLDFSGSTVHASGMEFINIGDKAVSAGEKSIISLINSTIQKVGIGIASKDLSQVTADNITITDARVAGLAAYIKKPQYGPAYLNANRIVFSGTEQPTLCQIKSTLMLSGQETDCQDVDVESLYEQGILGN